MKLNHLMTFGDVIYSDGKGNIAVDFDIRPVPWINEVIYQSVDDEGMAVADDIYNLPVGWELLTGFSAQFGYDGPVMHPSESLRGALAGHIYSTQGYFAAVVVEGLPEDIAGDEETEEIGWAVAYRPL